MAYETPLVLEASELMTGDGGDGGQGGAGSTGGTGGAGGEGTEVDLTIDGVEKGMGGDGGDGGTGGTGGGGSGGMGGASVGIMSRGAEVSIDEFTTFDLGEVGEGEAVPARIMMGQMESGPMYSRLKSEISSPLCGLSGV